MGTRTQLMPSFPSAPHSLLVTWAPFQRLFRILPGTHAAFSEMTSLPVVHQCSRNLRKPEKINLRDKKIPEIPSPRGKTMPALGLIFLVFVGPFVYISFLLQNHYHSMDIAYCSLLNSRALCGSQCCQAVYSIFTATEFCWADVP